MISKSPDVVFWKRYIDDVIFVTKTPCDLLLETANSINPSIQFTIELPINNVLPYLDTQIHLTGQSFQFQLFIKPSHSGTCLSYDSYTPKSRKKCLIHSEMLRAQRISSPTFLNDSVNKVTQRLVDNGYPRKIIETSKRGIQTDNSEDNKQDFVSYIRIPFINTKQRHKIIQLHKRSGMNDIIRLIFTTEKPLARQFRPKPAIPPCPPNCIACVTAMNSGCCFTKYAVYLITCDLCSQHYIGETERTIRSRIIEHTKTKTSHVYAHMQSHGNDHLSSFKWKILATHPNTTTRLAIESINIKKHNNLMNGCAGVNILPFLI